MKNESGRPNGATLDPADWGETVGIGRQMIDFAARHFQGLRERPVWQPMPETVRARFEGPLPLQPEPLADIFSDMKENLFPYAMGNTHPRFFSWYMGASNFTGALADFLAGIDGSNLGAGDTASAAVDRQATRWITEMLGCPEGSSAVLVNGGSMANIIGLTAARNTMAGVDLHAASVADMPQPLVFYASDQVHSCHMKAMNLLGLGGKSLRKIPTDANLRMDIGALREAIAADRAAGRRPACVIATAGTTNTGAIDPLPEIAALCREEALWMHIDGCVGALIALSPRYRHMVRGMEEADSLALDLHKGLQAPFDVGCAVLRDRAIHRRTFSENAEYLQNTKRGIAAAEFLHDYTAETSRSFRALKVWMMLRHHGAAAFGRLIECNIEQAHDLAKRIAAEPELELAAPVETSIVCFRHNPGGLDEAGLKRHNTEIMLRLQERGIAAPSDTTIRGRHCIRAAFCNHRTTAEDIAILVREVKRIGAEVAAEYRLETSAA